jgi:hypothetical protein
MKTLLSMTFLGALVLGSVSSYATEFKSCENKDLRVDINLENNEINLYGKYTKLMVPQLILLDTGRADDVKEMGLNNANTKLYDAENIKILIQENAKSSIATLYFKQRGSGSEAHGTLKCK